MTTIVAAHQEDIVHVVKLEDIVIEVLLVVVATTRMIVEDTDLLPELVDLQWMTTDHQEDVTKIHTAETSHLIHTQLEVHHMIVHHQGITHQERDHILVKNMVVVLDTNVDDGGTTANIICQI